MSTQLEIGRITFTVTFDRIGRHHDVPPLEVTVDDGPAEAVAEELAKGIHKHARARLLSSEVEVEIVAGSDENTAPLTSADLRECAGRIVVGGFRTAGNFTVKAVTR